MNDFTGQNGSSESRKNEKTIKPFHEIKQSLTGIVCYLVYQPLKTYIITFFSG